MKLANLSADKKIADLGPQNGSPSAASVAIFADSSQPAPMPACLRRGEVAGLLQVSVWTVDRMAANGEIRKVKFGRAARFVRAEVEEFLNKKNN